MPELRWRAGQAAPTREHLTARPAVRRLAGAAVAAVVVAGAVAHVAARADLADARERVAARERVVATAAGATAAAADRAGAALAELTAASPGLRAAQEELTARTREREQAAARLAAARDRLATVEAELAATSAAGELQARQVEALRECLRGVTAVLNAVAVDDVRSAIDGLEEVAPACGEAERAAVAEP